MKISGMKIGQKLTVKASPDLAEKMIEQATAYNNTLAWKHEEKNKNILMGEESSDLVFGGRKTMCNVIEFPLPKWYTTASTKRIAAKTVPQKGTPKWHQYQIAVDTIKNPNKALMGGPSVKEAKETLKKMFGFSDSDIKELEK